MRTIYVFTYLFVLKSKADRDPSSQPTQATCDVEPTGALVVSLPLSGEQSGTPLALASSKHRLSPDLGLGLGIDIGIIGAAAAVSAPPATSSAIAPILIVLGG